MNMKKRILSLLLAVTLILGCLPAAFAAETGKTPGVSQEPIGLGSGISGNPDAQSGFAPAGDAEDEADEPEQSEPAEPIEKYEQDAEPFTANMESLRPKAEDVVTFIVEMETASKLEAGFTASQIAAQTATVQAHEARQNVSINSVKRNIAQTFGSKAEVGYTYTVGMTGLSVTTAYGNKDAIAAMKGVKNVYVAPTYSLPEDMTLNLGDLYAPQTNNATTMIGANVLNESGYTGIGMRIAILDTGIRVDHPSFQPLPEEKLNKKSLTAEEVDEVWKNLNASQTPLLNRAYQNTKIPFVFNYSSMDFNVANTYAKSDHGTHVAGIAAANKIEDSKVIGVAPDAQLLVFQVFQPSGGAGWETIMAALEDCIYLKADAINLSLGSAAGFVDPEGTMLDVVERFKETDIQLLIAVGNDTNSAYQNLTGLNMSLTSNPDNGLAGTPSTYSAALSVASVDNDGEDMLYFTMGERRIGYRDTAATDATRFLTNFSGQSLEYVVVPGNGADSDYADIDVAGKIALVRRGGNSFPEKQAAAQAAGAIGCVVYNNTTGMINMQINDGGDNIPCVFISKADGDFMAAQEDKTFTVNNGEVETFRTDRVVSSFSSWGVTPDLKLKPEIAGVGGNIYSCVDPDLSGSNYGTMSGTSMATPQVTGAAAVLTEYLQENYPELTGAELRQIMANLMMSTADPLAYSEDLEYSPRQQGSGLVNLVDATTSGAYLANADASEGRPKAEFGDDPERTGEYHFSFQIHNMDPKNEKSYTLDASVMTETIYADYFINNSPYALDADVTFTGPVSSQVLKYDFNSDGAITTADARVLLRDVTGAEKIASDDQHYVCRDVNSDGKVNMDDVEILVAWCAELDVDVDVLARMDGFADADVTSVTVPAGGTVNVGVTIKLTGDDKAYLEKFENGIYVEGFVYANSTDADGVDLQLPYVGFYGDWSDAPIFDSEDPNEASSYPINVFTQVTQIGVNPYFRDGKSGDQYNAFSYANPLVEIDFGMLRNAKKLSFTVTDCATGEEYYHLEGMDVAKTYFNANYGAMIPMYVSAEEEEVWNGLDKKGNKLPDGTKVTYTMEAWLDDGDDVRDDVYSFDITLDDEYPVIQNAYDLQNALRFTEDGRIFLTLDLYDNQNIAAVIFTNNDGIIMGKYEVDNVPGEALSKEYEITGFGSDMTIVLADYACNETEVDVALDLGSHTSEPVLKALDSGRLYGCETYDGAVVEGGWFSANKADLSDPRNETFDSTNRYYSAEYINGYLIAQSAVTGDLVLVTPSSSYWGTQTLVSQNGASVGEAGVWVLYDMALDYSEQGSQVNDPWQSATGTDTLYAVGWKYAGDTDNDGRDDGANTLFRIWISKYNGQVFVDEVARITGTQDGGEMLTLACSKDGNLYGIDTAGKFYSISHTGECTYIGTTEFVNYANYSGCNVIQSMGFDHNTETLYWYAHSQTPNGNTNINVCETFIVDPATGKCTEVGTYGPSGQTCLFVPSELESDLFTMGVDPQSFELEDYELTMAQGQYKKMGVNWTPWNARTTPITWTSENEQVATVSAAGVIKAVGEGTTSVAATAQVWDPWAGEYNEETFQYEGAWVDRTVTCQVEVVASEEALYGYIITDYKNSDNDFSWVTYSDQTPGIVTQLSKPTVPTKDPYTGEITDKSPLWQGGAYYQGYLYTVQAEVMEDETGTTGAASVLYRSKVTKGATPADTIIGEPERIGGTIGVEVGNIGFDYTTGRMYCVDLTYGGLGIIDLDTGSVDQLGTFSGDIGGPAIAPAMCVTNEGQIIISDMYSNLYLLDPDTLSTTKIGTTGDEYWYYAALTYDYNTGNIYWSPCMGAKISPLYLVLLETNQWSGTLEANIVDIGDVSSKSGVQQTVLFTIPDAEPETQQIPVAAIDITDGESVVGLQGGTKKLSVVTEPARPTVQAKTWTSSNENVVKVDRFGNLTYVGVGTATVTVSISNKHPEDGGPFTDSIQVTVYESAGRLDAFLGSDEGGSGYYDFWINMNDYDLRHASAGESMISVYSLRSGTYYDGYYYAYNDAGEFYRIDANNHSDFVTLGKVNLDLETDQVVAMAFDYTTGNMYGLTLSRPGAGVMGKLVTVNLDNGSVTEVATLDTAVYALAADSKGTLYAAGSPDYYTDGALYTLNKTTGAATKVMDMPGAKVYTGDNHYGQLMYNSQMTYDFGTDRLYLNASSTTKEVSSYSGMYMFQLGGEIPDMASLDGISLYTRNGSTIKKGNVYLGLLAAVPEESEIPVGKVNGINMVKDFGRVAVGSTMQLNAVVRPSNAANKNILFTSADPAIATVSETGLVTGVKAGTTTITATSEETPSASKSFTVTVVETSGPQSTAYTISAQKDALISFNPELPGSTAEVVATVSGGSKIKGMAMGSNCLYYIVDNDVFPDLYRFDFTTKQSTFIATLNVWTTSTGLAYDEVNNLIYVTAGFYIFQFDVSKLTADATASYSNYVMDSDYCTLQGVVCIDGAVYALGNDYYTSATKLVKYSDKYLSDRQVVIDGLNVNTTADKSELSYDSSRELFYVTDAGDRLYSFDLAGNITRIDTLGDGIDLNGLAIDPAKP